MTTRKVALLCSAGLLTPLAVVLGICILFVAAVAGGAAENEEQGGDGSAGPGTPSEVEGVHPTMLAAYGRAAERGAKQRPKCKGLRWSVIAGIGKVESNHAAGRKIKPDGTISPRILGPQLNGAGVGGNTTPIYDTDGGRFDGDTEYDRAVGPMQFIPSTWAGPSGADGNDDGKKDPNNAFDAALGTALYLCGTGTIDLNDQTQARRAILRYNASGQYADDVLGHIREYDQLSLASLGSQTTAPGKAGKVIKLALAQRGTKYVWGGGDIHGPTKGGFDCSGLLVYAYYQGAGVTLPRTSQAMRSAGKAVPRSGLLPGDLIVFNNDGNWGHVGLYIGNGQMVHAPNPRTPVETASVTTGEWARHDWAIRRVL
ncbi:bifunctional lytic transglycosylase/C40 family peptidase [Streptomyces albidoflavus]|uniref:C40 family peptidase n=1 Tax=Streptomyces albidoflavus TaxID=1886 RepID=UPI00342C0EA2